MSALMPRLTAGIISLIALLLYFSPVTQAESEDQGILLDKVIQPASPSSGLLVYLHGLDGVAPSDQELHNREVLQRLSKELEVTVLVVRSQWRRNTGQRHWPRSPAEAGRILEFVKALTSKYGADSPGSWRALLGFSNGGYFLLQAWAGKKLDFVDSVIISGGGSEVPFVKYEPHPSIHLIAGDNDKYHLETMRTASRQLDDVDIEHTFQLFTGGHQLDFESLSRTLRLLKKKG